MVSTLNSSKNYRYTVVVQYQILVSDTAATAVPVYVVWRQIRPSLNDKDIEYQTPSITASVTQYSGTCTSRGTRYLARTYQVPGKSTAGYIPGSGN